MSNLSFQSKRQKKLKQTKEYLVLHGFDNIIINKLQNFTQLELLQLSKQDLIDIIDNQSEAIRLHSKLKRLVIGINDKNLSVEDMRFLSAIKKQQQVEEKQLGGDLITCGIEYCQFISQQICYKCKMHICIKHTQQSIFSSNFFCQQCYKSTTIGKIDHFLH